MKISASTRSGFTSPSLRTAASPLFTATTSTPRSARASATVFWTLLLSSATRIFATGRPPDYLGPTTLSLFLRTHIRPNNKGVKSHDPLEHRGTSESTKTRKVCVWYELGREH